MEVRNNIGFAADLQISEDAAFWVDGDCLNSSDAPMRLQDGQRLKVHRLEGFCPSADIEQVRGKVCVIIYQADGMRYAVVKEIVGLDEITGSLRLKYYNPEETIVSLKIDTIEGVFLVDGVVELELLPIDFDLSLQEVETWHKQWCISRYGSDSLNTERYYNISPDGRYLYGVREGESLNDEKSKCDKVLDLLLRLRLINQKLNGKRLSQHLQRKDREELKREREGLYKEFLDEVQADIVREQPEPLQTLKKLGRKPKSFSDCILLNNRDYLPRLKKLMRGLSPDAAIELIKNAINNKAIIRPPYNAFKREFPDVAKDIPESTYYNQLKKH